jgi:hypothetical protein
MIYAIRWAQSIESVCLSISVLANEQEKADYHFEIAKNRLNKLYLNPRERSLKDMLEMAASPFSQVSELKEVYKPKVFRKQLITRPEASIGMTCLRALDFIGATFAIFVGLGLSIMNHSWKDLKDSIGDFAQLTRLFIRGVFKSVPFIGPLLGRAWTILNVVLGMTASKIVSYVSGESKSSVYPGVNAENESSVSIFDEEWSLV